jgi:23S rRNA (pseudouridine1915-N3)-methyltransferase
VQTTIISVGSWKDKALKEAFAGYAARCHPPLELVELELPARDTHGDTKSKEAILITKHLPPSATIIACDERGKQFSSRAFASALQAQMDARGPRLAFIIGGADGLDASIVKQAHVTLSLGQATWPHLLARVMLAEQIYRAQTILAGHPYHRD